MTTTTQQTPSNPAIDFANMVLAETDNAREIIDLLHDIAQGQRQNSTTRDRINASRILLDRGLGKCPKQPLDIDVDTDNQSDDTDNQSDDTDNQSDDTDNQSDDTDNQSDDTDNQSDDTDNQSDDTDNQSDDTDNQSDDTDNQSDDTDVGAIRESPQPDTPESPGLVTQLDQSLQDQLGPPPTIHNPQSTKDSPLSPIHHAIQKHILDITDNGRTIMVALRDICRAPDGDPKVKDSHRVTAGRMLLDRILGTGRALEAPQKKPYVRPVRQIDPDDLAEARAEIQRMKDEGILTPDPNAPPIPGPVPEIPEGFDPTPYLKEASEKFWANIDMTLERQKAWPAIEERRRKKLAQIYPSHSEDDKPPDP